jgi:hypothetical protein
MLKQLNYRRRLQLAGALAGLPLSHLIATVSPELTSMPKPTQLLAGRVASDPLPKNPALRRLRQSKPLLIGTLKTIPGFRKDRL